MAEAQARSSTLLCVSRMINVTPRTNPGKINFQPIKTNITARCTTLVGYLKYKCGLYASVYRKYSFLVPVVVASSYAKIELRKKKPDPSPKERFLRKLNFVSIFFSRTPARSWPCHILCSIHLINEPNYLEQRALSLLSMGNWAITNQNHTKNAFSYQPQRTLLHDALSVQGFLRYFCCGSKA